MCWTSLDRWLLEAVLFPSAEAFRFPALPMGRRHSNLKILKHLKLPGTTRSLQSFFQYSTAGPGHRIFCRAHLIFCRMHLVFCRMHSVSCRIRAYTKSIALAALDFVTETS